MKAGDLIRLLKLKKHPLEGGFYRETYRSDRIPVRNGKPDQAVAGRSLATAIYYLLTPDTFSEIHRLAADEIFHFYLGDPVEMLQLFPGGDGSIIIIGNDMENGCQPQVLVPGGIWQGCRLIPGGRFALMGTTMSPGFDFHGYESGNRERLTGEFPGFRGLITELTRSPQ